mmetsp:Transcript_15685/g.24003  ORF Transcript_15685/g.24003 Transcript_15685/m.24003 type:complete len:367 (-) Transcript_15685:201-1301(-)
MFAFILVKQMQRLLTELLQRQIRVRFQHRSTMQMKAMHKHMRDTPSNMIQQFIAIIKHFPASFPSATQLWQTAVLVDIVGQHRIRMHRNQLMNTFILQMHIVLVSNVLHHIKTIHMLQNLLGRRKNLCQFIIAKPAQIILPYPIGMRNNRHTTHGAQHIQIVRTSNLAQQQIQIVWNVIKFRKRVRSILVKRISVRIQITRQRRERGKEHIALQQVTKLETRKKRNQHLLHRRRNAIDIKLAHHLLIIIVELDRFHRRFRNLKQFVIFRLHCTLASMHRKIQWVRIRIVFTRALFIITSIFITATATIIGSPFRATHQHLQYLLMVRRHFIAQLILVQLLRNLRRKHMSQSLQHQRQPKLRIQLDI